MAGRIILGIANPSLDSDGAVGAGSTLTFYQNGTTTLVSIYTAPGLLTPLPNPLTCDAAGRFPQIWVDDSVRYSVKWSVPGESAITYDDINAVAIPVLVAVRTRQVKLSGTAATYTTPAGCRQINIRMVGGGGGGGGNSNATSTNGGTGGTTSFNSVTAIGGTGGSTSANPGIGGAGGAGSPTGVIRIAGGGGGPGMNINNTIITANNGGAGGNSVFGGGAAGATSTAGATNSGGGGSGAGNSSPASAGNSGGGGGAGEYVEFLINSPSATYTYSVGAAGAAGTIGSPGAGGSGIIIVDEFY